MSMPNNPAYNFTSYAGWSFGFWFNGSGISANNGLFMGQDNASGYNPKWFIDYGYSVYGNSGNYYFHVNDYNQERIFIPSQAEPAPTGWNQLTVTINNTNNGAVNFYLNGQPIGQGFLGNYTLRTSAPLIFGQAEGLSYNGLMSNVVIYNRVLTTNEVQQLATVPPNNGPFSITDAHADGHGNIVITWQSTPGSTYQVESAASLVPPANWASNVGSPVLATNTSTSATIPIISSMKFFRVRNP